MTVESLLARVRVDPEVCSGRPYIRGTRIRIAIILDALTEGLSPAAILDHYAALEFDDLRAALEYASQLAQANGGFAIVNHQPQQFFQTR
ncbi:MAG: DUF433 domain-containing protein [Deltaproteobacteria bacterium]|nr:DUF433 domain-containing protein [Deltaproteobacteria bacterium]